MRTLLLLALVSCTPAAGAAISADTAAGPAILHTLAPADGLAVRGALTELGGRLYGLAGEAGPNGTERCNSGAAWQTIEHTAHCPGALFSVALAPTAAGGPTGADADFRVEHAFTQLVDGVNADGYHPYGTLGAAPPTPEHPAGRLCGVTQMGGAIGYGVAFCFDPAGGAFDVLHHFGSEPGGADGLYPMGAVAVGPDGAVYGTAKSGVLWSWSAARGFAHAPLLGEVYGGVTLDSGGGPAGAGRLHGATWTGTATTGGGWYFTADAATLTVESTPLTPTPWPAHGSDNTPIQAPLVLRGVGRAGTVILPREWAGPAGAGALLVPFGTLWQADDIPLDAVPRFANLTGAMPNGQLAEGPDGSVYFSAQYGGAFGTGAIARVGIDGSGFSLLWSWPDGAYPYGGVTLASDGALYGVTFDTSQVWRLAVTAAR